MFSNSEMHLEQTPNISQPPYTSMFPNSETHLEQTTKNRNMDMFPTFEMHAEQTPKISEPLQEVTIRNVCRTMTRVFP